MVPGATYLIGYSSVSETLILSLLRVSILLIVFWLIFGLLILMIIFRGRVLVLLSAVVEATIAVSGLLLLVMPSVELRVVVCPDFSVNFRSAPFALLLLRRYSELLWMIPLLIRVILMILKSPCSRPWILALSLVVTLWFVLSVLGEERIVARISVHFG